jgi:hypothetical protein
MFARLPRISTRLCIFGVTNLLLAAFHPNPCDPELSLLSSGPYGYRLRGDICEGLYVQQVAGSALQLVSLTSYFEDFNPEPTQNLVIAWKSPTKAETHVRARATDRRIYFRMDAIRAAPMNDLRWPAGLLSALGIRRDRLGVLAWTDSENALGTSTLYLPVGLGDKKSFPGSGDYSLALIPGRELGEVYITLSRIDQAGRAGRPIRDAVPLGLNYYPAGQRIDFPIANPGSEGIYYLEIGATLKTGGSITLPVYFYHAGREK